MLDSDVVKFLHYTATPPSIQQFNIPSSSDQKNTHPAETLHKILGFRNLKRYKHMTDIAEGTKYLDNGKVPVRCGQFATIKKVPAHGKEIEKEAPHYYLKQVHLTIAFGDCLSIKGYICALVFAD